MRVREGWNIRWICITLLKVDVSLNQKQVCMDACEEPDPRSLPYIRGSIL